MFMCVCVRARSGACVYRRVPSGEANTEQSQTEQKVSSDKLFRT